MVETVFIGLCTPNLGTKTLERKNPFTGAKIIAHVDNPVTAAQVAAGARVLDEVSASPPDPDGFRKVPLGEDRYLEVELGLMGAEIHITGGLQMDAIALVFRIASASAMLVTSTIDPDVVAVLPEQRRPEIYERWPSAVDIDTPDDLFEWAASEIARGRV
jgi:hypothetical protein